MKKEKWHRNRKIGIFILAGIFIALTVLRILHVNSGIMLPEVRTYEMGEIVDLSGSIFVEEYENASGYRMRVNKASFMTFEDFLERHMLDAEKNTKIEENAGKLPDYVYDLDVTFINTNIRDNGCGVDLSNYNIYADDFLLSIDPDLYAAANAEKKSTSMMFSLRPDSELDFCLPYPVATSGRWAYLSVEDIRAHDLYLYVSLYPVRNQIIIYQKGDRN